MLRWLDRWQTETMILCKKIYLVTQLVLLLSSYYSVFCSSVHPRYLCISLVSGQGVFLNASLFSNYHKGIFISVGMPTL